MAVRCGFFFTFCSVHCLVVVFDVDSSSIAITSMGKRELVTLVLGIYTVCHALFALLVGVIGKLCSMVVALPLDLYYSNDSSSGKTYFITMV